MNFYQILRPAIFKIEPETAHNLAIKFLKFNPCFPQVKEYENLSNKLWNLDFKNPVGMAAGFDKNAEISKSLSKFGFGFV